MNCPHCNSNRVSGPSYVYQASLRVAATMTCGSCETQFDAYNAWGTGRLTMLQRRLRGAA